MPERPTFIYLGLDIWRSGPMAFEPVHHGNPSEDASFGRRFSQGFYVAAANPKALVFFSALFPHFIDTMGSPLSQYLLLVVPLGFIAFVCMMIYALGSAKITGLFNLTGLKNYFNKLVGGSFIALGIGIAASDR